MSDRLIGLELPFLRCAGVGAVWGRKGVVGRAMRAGAIVPGLPARGALGCIGLAPRAALARAQAPSQP
jgi:hypothetical protein